MILVVLLYIMKRLLLLSAALAVSTASLLTAGPVIKEYKEGDRYFFFPGDNNELYLVDAEDPIDYGILLAYNHSHSGYWLFTRTNPTEPQILKYQDADSIAKSNYDFKKVTVFSAHGWNGDGKNDNNKLLRDAFLKDGDVNFIVLDWSPLAGSFNYNTAKSGTAEVGKYLGQFVKWMVELGMSYDKTHLVGFSLGAHLVGNAGKECDNQIKRITGLDPAGPLWGSDAQKLDKSNGKYVEVIHTNSRVFGYTDPLGHADFYVNGGKGQPACWFPICSHSMAYQYMASTVENKHLKGKKCTDYQEMNKDRCTGTEYIMGTSDMSKSGEGIYRTNTQNDYPYVKPNGAMVFRQRERGH